MSSIVCACGKPVEVRSDCAGQWISCPNCGGTLYQPFPGDKPSVPTAAPTRLCAVCSETIPVSDATCRFCGGNPDGVAPVRPAAPPPPSSTSDPGLPSLIVSIIAYSVCGLLGPVAWVMASKCAADCRSKGVEVPTSAKAGRILGIIGTIIFVLNVIFSVIWVVASCL
jgi:hypothetical protein